MHPSLTILNFEKTQIFLMNTKKVIFVFFLLFLKYCKELLLSYLN